jgi:antitoxin ParD1/3/4
MNQITLPADLLTWAEAEVAAGRAVSVDLLVVEILERHREGLDALRSALIEGEESGPAEPFDFDGFLAAKRSV